MKDFLDKEWRRGSRLNSLLSAVDAGKNEFLNIDRTEKLEINTDWIEAMEGAIGSIERIVANPRIFIVSNNYIVPVEKAKKTDSKSVEYLLQHSGDIEKFTEDNVIPKKVLITEYDDDMAIYENRFVITLINFMYNFLEVRFSALKEKNDLKGDRKLDYTSDFKTDNFDITCDFSVKIVASRPSDEAAKNELIIARIYELEKRVNNLRVSKFYEQLCKVKPVYPPIKMTNLLRAQVDYHNCYNLYMFLSNYIGAGYVYENEKKRLPIDNMYSDDLKKVLALGIDTVFENDKERKQLYSFVNGKLFKPQRVKPKKDTNLDFEFSTKEYSATIKDCVFNYFQDRMKELSKVSDDEYLSPDEEYTNSIRVYRDLHKEMTNILDNIYAKYVEPDRSEPTNKIERMERQLSHKREMCRKYSLIKEINKEKIQEYALKEQQAQQSILELKEKIKLAKAEYNKQRKAEMEEQRRQEAEKAKLQKAIEDSLKKKKYHSERLQQMLHDKRVKEAEEREKAEIARIKKEKEDFIKQFMAKDEEIYQQKLREYEDKRDTLHDHIHLTAGQIAGYSDDIDDLKQQGKELLGSSDSIGLESGSADNSVELNNLKDKLSSARAEKSFEIADKEAKAEIANAPKPVTTRLSKMFTNKRPDESELLRRLAEKRKAELEAEEAEKPKPFVPFGRKTIVDKVAEKPAKTEDIYDRITSLVNAQQKAKEVAKKLEEDVEEVEVAESHKKVVFPRHSNPMTKELDIEDFEKPSEYLDNSPYDDFEDDNLSNDTYGKDDDNFDDYIEPKYVEDDEIGYSEDETISEILDMDSYVKDGVLDGKSNDRSEFANKLDALVRQRKLSAEDKLLLNEYDKLSVQQQGIDLHKWNKSKQIGRDFCGLYEFCVYCDKSRDLPCARALRKYNNNHDE